MGYTSDFLFLYEIEKKYKDSSCEQVGVCGIQFKKHSFIGLKPLFNTQKLLVFTYIKTLKRVRTSVSLLRYWRSDF